jgi:membrane protease YdiL (CAAX protease family)
MRLHPMLTEPVQYIGDALRNIDDTTDRSDGLRDEQLWSLLLMTSLCLLGLNYLKNWTSLQAFIGILGDLYGVDGRLWQQAFRDYEFRGLLQLGWWCLMHILFCLLIPFLLIRYSYKRQLREFGWQWGQAHRHWADYALLTLPILFFIALVSFRPDFTREYPFYSESNRSWLDLLAWWSLYIIQFIGVEFLFRGFLLNGLRPRFGSYAIAIMCIPYMMIHFPKLWLEATGAIFFGFFLGILALRSRSIWGGVLVHVTIALSMDTAALIQTDRLPVSLFRL